MKITKNEMGKIVVPMHFLEYGEEGKWSVFMSQPIIPLGLWWYQFRPRRWKAFSEEKYSNIVNYAIFLLDAYEQQLTEEEIPKVTYYYVHQNQFFNTTKEYTEEYSCFVHTLSGLKKPKVGEKLAKTLEGTFEKIGYLDIYSLVAQRDAHKMYKQFCNYVQLFDKTSNEVSLKIHGKAVNEIAYIAFM